MHNDKQLLSSSRNRLNSRADALAAAPVLRRLASEFPKRRSGAGWRQAAAIEARVRKSRSAEAAGGAARNLRWLTTLVLAMAFGLVTRLAAAAVIDSARITERGELTRVELFLDRDVPFRLSVLGNPDRVAVDLPELRWSVPGKGYGGGIVDGLRAATFRPGTTRVVIDCRHPVRVHNAELTRVRSGVFRLSIDVGSHGAPIAAGGGSATKARPTPTASSAGGAESTAAIDADRPPLIGATGLGIGDVGEDASATMSAFGAGPALSPPLPRPSSRHSSSQLAARAREGGPVRAPAPVRRVVVIDPGHGGRDPGAIGRSGIYEKQITLAFSRQLRDELRAGQRYRVLLTRDRDAFIRLRDRSRIARTAGADLFLSIHANKMADSTTRGLSLYTLSERASDAEAAALAEHENKADLIVGLDLDGQPRDVMNLLIDIAQRETMNRSAEAAVTLVRELRETVVLLPKAHRFAGFAVLKAPDVPSVLIELGYLSNPAEERLLRQPEYRKRLARAMARAVDAYFERDMQLAGGEARSLR